MNFLKENVFLTVTAAIVLVGGVLLLLVISFGDGQADANAKPYVSEGKEINSLASAGVNKKMVDAVVQRVKDMRIKAEEVTEVSLLRNRRDYEVLSFDISGQTVPAFPVDREFKDRETLRLLFPEKYRLCVKDLREMLKPTVPPTAEEISNEIARIAASVMPEETKDRTGPTTPRAVEHRREVEMRERYRPSDMERERRPTGRLTGMGDAESDIERQALINLIIRKSEEGWIYADKREVQADRGDRRSAAGGTSGGGTMHVALPLTEDYNDDSLWLAQVGLWVQRDIVEAINLTNSQVRRTISPARRGVAASAVKRLMGIDVRGYVLRAAGTATLQYLDIDERKTSEPVPQLTGRACNKLYDVIHYDFTVILPMRHLLRLQKNLMTRNYHTILAVGITRPAQSGVHYYGTDSVMEVTIVGEMLMLADWTRGRWDKQAKEWDKNYPPMMPVLFMEEMRNMDAGAMRDEDNRRLPADTETRVGSFSRNRERREERIR